MSSEIYVALSGQMAMQTRLATVANNLANMRTAGFRAQTVTFETVLSEYGRDAVAFAAADEAYLDRAAGPVEATGNMLDVAIVGEGWFAIETAGGTAYTRDGRFHLNVEGDLLTLTGHRVLDDGGAPIQIDPAGGAVDIGGDGRIIQAGRDIGILGLFSLAPEARLSRYGDSAVLSPTPGEPIVDRAANGVRQGYLEGANVNAIRAIAELIEIQRAFEYANATIEDRQQTLQEAVRILGSDQ